jgi:vacuolar-type H+-ATPase subunit I/STV1
LTDVRQQLEAAEADRAARLAVIEQQGLEIADLTASRNEQSRQLAEGEQIRASQSRQLAEGEQIRASQSSLIEAQAEQIRVLMAQLRIVQGVLHAIRGGRVYRWLRRLGRWGWVEAMLAQETPIN